MGAYDDDKDDKPERTEQRPESITDQLSFKSRFVLLFGEINQHGRAHHVRAARSRWRSSPMRPSAC